jgi:hypothetical protein
LIVEDVTAGTLEFTTKDDVELPPLPPCPEIATALAAEFDLLTATPVPVAVVVCASADELVKPIRIEVNIKG